MSQKGARLSIGPVLPPGFKRGHDDGDCDEIDAKKIKTGSIGPALPPGFQQLNAPSSDSDDDIIGPVMPTSGESENYSGAAADIERRSHKMRKKLLNEGNSDDDDDDDDDKPKGRESWMTELPEKHELSRIPIMPVARTRLGDGRAEIDHSWTLKPGEKPSTTKHKDKNVDQHVPSQRDREMAAAVAEYNKTRRAASLLEMHQKKLDKKKKKKEKKDKKEKKKKKKKEKEKKKETEERRTFDRDLDLKANVFDDAKKKALIKKSQVLNTRFGHGSTQYL